MTEEFEIDDDLHPIDAVRADEVRVGDIIDWCGRRMPVMAIQPKVSAGGRAGRWFTVEINGRWKQLHWWDHERVSSNVVNRPPLGNDGSPAGGTVEP